MLFLIFVVNYSHCKAFPAGPCTAIKGPNGYLKLAQEIDIELKMLEAERILQAAAEPTVHLPHVMKFATTSNTSITDREVTTVSDEGRTILTEEVIRRMLRLIGREGDKTADANVVDNKTTAISTKVVDNSTTVVQCVREHLLQRCDLNWKAIFIGSTGELLAAQIAVLYWLKLNLFYFITANYS